MTHKTSNLSESDATHEVVFPAGIPGFEHLTRYQILYSDTESGRVYWMESCEDTNVSFTLVDPKLYSLSYELELTDEEEHLLQAETAEDVVVLLMLWKEQNSDGQTKPGLHANIAAPILINVEKRIGIQKLIPSPKLETGTSG